MNKYPSIREKFMTKMVNRLCFMGSGGDEYKEQLWSFIEQSLQETEKRVREEDDTRVHNKSNIFWLERSEDVSGVSGTGVVADGIIFPGGVAVLRWRTAGGSTAVYDNIEDLERIHGHDGRTKIVYPYRIIQPKVEAEK